MTILEQLREKKRNIQEEIEEYLGTANNPNSVNILADICNQYDLALENALLKLKNRGVEIKDLKHRLEDANLHIANLIR